MNHDEALAKSFVAFIVPHRRERYLGFLTNPKKRKKLMDELAHFKALNPEVTVDILPSQQNPFGIAGLLKAKGAGSKCWVISENQDLDRKELDLQTALKETVGCQMGTFISCIPERLAYFENEDGRWILQR